MSDYLYAYASRLKRNEAALLKLADEVIALDPEVEVYHSETHRHISSIVFFKGENINSVAFHEVPYRWSGCGYGEHSRSHSGGENSSMPFTAQDVLNTFKPVTTVHSTDNKFHKSKAEYLKWHSWLIKHQTV